MQKVLISMPESIVSRLRSVIPDRHRSKFITGIVEEELNRREEALYQCALKVEQDEALNQEMKDWEVTSADGMDHESW